MGEGGSYTGTNITLINNYPFSGSPITASGAYIFNQGQLSLTGGKIETSGSAAHGIVLANASTGTITDVNITTTGQDAHALHLLNTSTATANLSNTTTTDNSTIDITLKDTQLTGTATHDETSAINLKIETGTQLKHLHGNINTLTLQNGATLSFNATHITLLLNGDIFNNVFIDDLLTLGNGTIIEYGIDHNLPLILTGNLAIGENILVDLSNLTETGLYTILDWSGATVTGDITADQFNIATPGVEGTFTVNTENKQLTFNATAIPEPSVWFLLGAGLTLLLITTHHRRRGFKN
jgi:hypothetical protein